MDIYHKIINNISHFGVAYNYTSCAKYPINRSREGSGMSIEQFTNFRYSEYDRQETVWFLVSRTDKKGKGQTDIDEEEEEKEDRFFLCRYCENKIARYDHMMEVSGNFEHTFLNPGGHVFRIGCFEAADGCLYLGVPTTEWTWFEGFEWQVALCNKCQRHLGWFYRSRDERNFFGLILDLLV